MGRVCADEDMGIRSARPCHSILCSPGPRSPGISYDWYESLIFISETIHLTLVSIPLANEDIWSAVHDSICGDLFPMSQAAWKDSLSSTLIERFYLYLNRLPPNLADRKVDETVRQVIAFVAVVGVLDYITFDIPTEPKGKDDQEEEDPFFTSKKPQRKRRNTTRARQNTVVIDPRLFTAIDFDVPTSPDELAVTEICIFERLNHLLKVFRTALGISELKLTDLNDIQELLQFFTGPKLAEHAKQLFFKQPLQYIPIKLVPSADVAPVSETTSAVAPDLGAFPHIRPLAAAKYFDDEVGLGPWPIFVSGRAVKHLRQMQKRDSRGFTMVQKKITWVAFSRSHFVHRIP